MLQRIGRYEILERIAAGGQGTVYRARDTVLDRVVAVKVLDQPVTDDPQYLEALQREFTLAASLDHPNVITVYDFQVEDGTAYIVMEYVPASLNKQFRAEQPLPYQRAVEVAIEVCRGLAHAHQNGAVHRDIKPQNILLTGEGIAKVSDFGIARALASSIQSRTTRTMGTSWYLSPEQWSGSSVDGRADLYSLGILLYEMLTGLPRFEGESMEALFVQHRKSPLPSLPGQLGVPGAVEDVVRKALEKRAEDRFADADVMATALEGSLTRADDRESLKTRAPGREIPIAPTAMDVSYEALFPEDARVIDEARRHIGGLLNYSVCYTLLQDRVMQGLVFGEQEPDLTGTLYQAWFRSESSQLGNAGVGGLSIQRRPFLAPIFAKSRTSRTLCPGLSRNVVIDVGADSRYREEV